MIVKIKCAEFMSRFPAANQLGSAWGRWADEADRVHYYYSNTAGEVGEIIYNPSDTVSTYGIVTGEPAIMLKSMYGK